MRLNTTELLDNTATLSPPKLLEAWGVFTPFGAHTSRVAIRVKEICKNNPADLGSTDGRKAPCAIGQAIGKSLLCLIAIPVDILFHMSCALSLAIKAGALAYEKSPPCLNKLTAIVGAVVGLVLSIAFLSLLIIPRAIGTVAKPVADGVEMAKDLCRPRLNQS